MRPPLNVTYFDISPPLRDMAAARGAETAPAHASLALGPEPVTSSDAHAGDGELQGALGVAVMPAPAVNFNATPGTGGITPPSPSADVGPNHYFLASNIRLQIFDKLGSTLLGPVNNNVIWAGFGGPCETTNPGSPIVLYDQLADRWLLSQATTSAPYSLCVALSVTGDPTGAYYRWSISTGDNFTDAPKWALWPNAYLVGTREFAGPFVGAGAYALDRAQMLAGNPSPTVLAFLIPPGGAPYAVGDGLLPADLDGSTLPPGGSAAYFLGSMDLGGPYGAPQDALTLWRFVVDFVNPGASSFTIGPTLPVSTFDSIYPCPGGGRRCIPQPGVTTSQYLDILSYRQRLLNRVSYRNLGTHESIVANQSVEAATSMAGIRWYELRNPGGAAFVHQQGTFAPGVADNIQRWCGGIAMDRVGNIALGYSVSDAVSVFPGIRYTGRLAADPAGTMPQGEGVIVDGGGAQTSTSNRWGDYSSMNVDPADDCTFWYVNEYYPVTSTTGWQLRVASFKFPSCTPAASADDDDVPALATALLPIGLARGPVSVRFTVAGADAGRVQILVVDVAGRLVRRLLDEELAGGQYHVTWDRTSDAGARLRPGVYHVRLRAGHAADAEGVVLLE
jgi:hypothetical protein